MAETGYVLIREDSHWNVYPTLEEAESEAEDIWDRLSDRAKDDVRIFQISRCDDLEGGVPPEDWDFDENCVRDFVREWEETPRTMDLYFTHDDRVFKLEVPNRDDVWKAIADYDRSGTDFWDHLSEEDILGVNLEAEYPGAERVIRWDDVEEDDRIREVTADIRVSSTGNSLILKITREARMLGIGRDDVVKVTIRRKS